MSLYRGQRSGLRRGLIRILLDTVPPSWVASGTASAGTTSVTPSFPAVASGDLLWICAANKYPTNGPATPAGWTAPSNNQFSGSSGSSGVDAGSVYITVFGKVSDGTETGTVTVTATSGNAMEARMQRFSKLGNRTWDYACAGGSDNTAGTDWSVTAGADPGIRKDDLILVATAINSDGAGTFSSAALTAPGCTFGTPATRGNNATSNGDDVALVMYTVLCTGGTSTGAPTWTMTATSSGANFPAGATIFVRMRQV